jgi:hypothetical protein
LLLEVLPFVVALLFAVFANLAIRKRNRLREHSEWDRIFDAAQMARQQIRQALYLSPGGRSTDKLEVRHPAEMPKLKLS